MSKQLTAAYSVCRGIARSQAKNFYYAFLALPKEKRNALCAVYAFMRHADDISDEETCPPEDRRRNLESWLDAWHQAMATGETDDPVFFALLDSQRKFHIPSELLDLLVHGTAMDLDPPVALEHLDNASRAPVEPVYRTFDDLYQYCYHVASVVGLVCIRIFGFKDPKAEKLAERCGIAFQLTNIIRDVKEDASNGRVYLPEEDLQRFGWSTAKVLAGNIDPREMRPLLQFQTERAQEYYKSGEELIPLIEEDSQPALWVLVTIYRSLLEKIAQKQFDVFSEKVRLRTTRKLAILARGMVKAVAL